MTQYLAFNVNDPVKLGGSALPGVVTSLKVRGRFEVEKKHMEGTSGSANLPKGFRDAAVEITLEILPGDVSIEAQIKQLEAAFKQGGVNTAKPMRIVNRHLDARGITKVLFVGLDTEDGDEWDSTLATLSFVEYEQMNVKAETSASTPVVTGPAGNLNADAGSGGGGGANQQPSIVDSFAGGNTQGSIDARPSAPSPAAAAFSEMLLKVAPSIANLPGSGQ